MKKCCWNCVYLDTYSSVCCSAIGDSSRNGERIDLTKHSCEYYLGEKLKTMFEKHDIVKHKYGDGTTYCCICTDEEFAIFVELVGAKTNFDRMFALSNVKGLGNESWEVIK